MIVLNIFFSVFSFCGTNATKIININCVRWICNGILKMTHDDKRYRLRKTTSLFYRYTFTLERKRKTNSEYLNKWTRFLGVGVFFSTILYPYYISQSIYSNFFLKIMFVIIQWLLLLYYGYKIFNVLFSSFFFVFLLLLSTCAH